MIYKPLVSGTLRRSEIFCAPDAASFYMKRQVHLKMYAVIETGGKQYQVNVGDVVFIEKLDVNAEDTVTFDKVIAVCREDGLNVRRSLC